MIPSLTSDFFLALQISFLFAILLYRFAMLEAV